VNDSGRFDANSGPMYRVFERMGAESEWQFQLPADPSKNQPQQFDYETISDVILHVRYTAREGGEALRTAALKNIQELTTTASASGCVRLFSIRQEFPAAWLLFKKQPANAAAKLTIDIKTEHYPYWTNKLRRNITGVEVFARSSGQNPPASLWVSDTAAGVNKFSLANSVAKSLASGELQNIAIPAPVGPVTFFIENNKMDDLYFAFKWSS
jgi:hypothetical protein